MYLGWGVNQVQGEESYYFVELQLTVQNYLLVFVAADEFDTDFVISVCWLVSF